MSSPVVTVTGIHWRGQGWYAPKIVRGIEVYYYLGPVNGLSLEQAKTKAAASPLGLGEPIQVKSKNGFTHVY